MALLHIGGWPTVCTPLQNSAGGGGADVEKTVAQGNLFSGRCCDSHVPVSHKRVLTAWLAPKRSTDKVD